MAVNAHTCDKISSKDGNHQTNNTLTRSTTTRNSKEKLLTSRSNSELQGLFHWES